MKYKVSISKTGLYFVFTLSFFLLAIVFLLENIYNLSFFCIGLDSRTFYQILIAICVISFSALISIASKKKWLKIATIVISILIIFSYNFLFMSFTKEHKYFSFSSPDNQHKLIVDEQAFLLYGGGDFYFKENTFFIKNTGHGYLTDNGYRPFSENAYAINWEENKVLIKYSFKGPGLTNEEVINLP